MISDELKFAFELAKKNFLSLFREILFTLAKQGRALGAYKLSRHALEKLSYLTVPARLENLVDTASVLIRATPFTDAEELLLMCYRP